MIKWKILTYKGEKIMSKNKKTIFKKWWFWVIIVFFLYGIGSSNKKQEETTETSTETMSETGYEMALATETADETIEETSTETTEETTETSSEEIISDEQFVEDVNAAIQGSIGQGESFKDVKLENRDLCVYVDLTDARLPSSLTITDIARSRTSSITDKILNLEIYDTLWDTITIDFGEIGYIRNGHDAIKNDGYGRYFDLTSNDTEDLLNDQEVAEQPESVAEQSAEIPVESDNTVTAQENQETSQLSASSENNPPNGSSDTQSNQGSSSTGTGNGDNFNTYDNPDQQNTTDTYVLNTSRMKIHHPNCRSVKKIAPQNYATSSSSLDDLISQGYSTCGICF